MEELYSFHDDKGFKADFSEFYGLFQAGSYANDKVIIWKSETSIVCWRFKTS
jgi:hypothetical protein